MFNFSNFKKESKRYSVYNLVNNKKYEETSDISQLSDRKFVHKKKQIIKKKAKNDKKISKKSLRKSDSSDSDSDSSESNSKESSSESDSSSISKNEFKRSNGRHGKPSNRRKRNTLLKEKGNISSNKSNCKCVSITEIRNVIQEELCQALVSLKNSMDNLTNAKLDIIKSDIVKLIEEKILSDNSYKNDHIRIIVCKKCNTNNYITGGDENKQYCANCSMRTEKSKSAELPTDQLVSDIETLLKVNSTANSEVNHPIDAKVVQHELKTDTIITNDAIENDVIISPKKVFPVRKVLPVRTNVSTETSII
jgi:hypothetical protein